MSSTTVKNLAETLSNSMLDAVVFNRLYTDTLIELAERDWFMLAQIISLTKGQSQVFVDTAVIGQGAPTPINMKGFIYNDRELSEAPLLQLEAVDSHWRDKVGSPVTYTFQDVDRKSIALFPAPDAASNPQLFGVGQALGVDYPTYNLLVFYSYAPTDPLAPFYYLELPIALRVMALEFNRVSDHQDQEFSSLCAEIAEMFEDMLL